MIDWPRVLRALTGRPEPVQIQEVIKEVPATASLDNLRAMIVTLGQFLTDQEQCQLWYEIETMAFNELGEVYLETYPITPELARSVILAQYPRLKDLKCPDGEYWATDLAGMQKLLTRDWTNMVPYVINKSDCDKFANRLYEHCCRYYNINTVFPVWGSSPGGYHAFNVCVLKNEDGWLARLIEPQTDQIFIDNGYVPETAAESLAVMADVPLYPMLRGGNE